MKQVYLYSFLILVFLLGCKKQAEIILQQEEKNIGKESIEYSFPELTSGSIDFEYFIKTGFVGSIFFQNDDEIVFEYQINSNRKLYPISNEKGQWQQALLEWNIESSSLRVSIDRKVQTTCLIKSEKIYSINKMVIRPDKGRNENEIRVKKGN